MTQLLKAKEVAKLLQVDRSTIYEWAREGWLPSVALSSGAVRFREEDVEEFVKTRTRPNGNGASRQNQAHQSTPSKEPHKVTRRRLLSSFTRRCEVSPWIFNWHLLGYERATDFLKFVKEDDVL